MRIVLSFFLYIVIVLPIFSQHSQVVDSLNLLLNQTTNEHDKVGLLNELAWQVRRSDVNLAYSYAEMADSISTSVGDKLGKATSYVRKGILAFYEGNYEKASDYYEKALVLRKSLNDKIGAVSVLNNLALIQLKQNNYEEAQKTYTEALNLLSYEENPPNVRAIILNNLGNLYQQQNQYNKATKALELAMIERKNLKDSLGLSKILLNKGNLFLEIKDFTEAEQCYLGGLELIEKYDDRKYTKAKFYFNLGALYYLSSQLELALQFCEKALSLEDYLNISDLIILYNNLAAILQKTGKLRKSKFYYLKNVELLSIVENKVELARVYYNLGHINIIKNNLEEAIEYLTVADSLLLAYPEPILKTQIAYDLSSVYSKKKNFTQAYAFNEKYSQIQDSLYQSYLNAATYQRNQAENQKKIAHLKVETTQFQLQSSEVKRQNQFYMGLGLISFITLLAGIAAFVAYRNRQQQLIAEYKTEKVYAEIDDLLVEQELKMVNAKLAAKDEEQQRIAKDLHDRLGAMLSVIKLYFRNINRHLKEPKSETFQEYQKANELLDEACAEVRLIAHNMTSRALVKFGLINGLKELITTISSSNQIDARLYTYGLKERLDEKTEAKIYKIILELVANVLKHAQAEKLNIQLNQIGEELNIVVEDNGKGFQPEQAEKKDGMGLRNIMLRVADLNGKLHIDSSKGNGTTVAIDIPITNNKNKLDTPLKVKM